MHGGYDRRRGKAFSDVGWLIRRKSLWKRFHEHVEEVCWTPDETRGALRQTGFGQVRAWDAAPLFKSHRLTRSGYRTFYLTRRTLAGRD